MTFSRSIRSSLMLVSFVCSICACAAWANLIVKPIPHSQSFLEGMGAGTTVGFAVFNKGGDPLDCCDNGLSHVSFYIEMSLGDPNSVPNTFTAFGLGVFVFNVDPGGSQGVGPNPMTLTDLYGCYFMPGGSPNPCPVLAGDPPFYAVSSQGNPSPAVADVNILDMPEPGSFTLLGSALLGLAGNRTAKIR